jgi:hypothetical protein
MKWIKFWQEKNLFGVISYFFTSSSQTVQEFNPVKIFDSPIQNFHSSVTFISLNDIPSIPIQRLIIEDNNKNKILDCRK